MDLNRQQFKTEFAGRPLVLEISRIAEQATASVIGRYDDTVVLVTATMGKKEREVDYFPLIVDYEERFYAAGKIIGSRFIRREGRASEDAVLSGRLIDRTIRPLFDDRMRREVQVVVTVLAFDEQNEPDFIALLAASTALAISKIPWGGPVAGLEVMGKPGSREFAINPKNKDRAEGFSFSAFVAGTENAVNMIELEGREADEDEVTRAFEAAGREIARLTEWQKEIVKKVGAQKETAPLREPSAELRRLVQSFLSTRLEDALYAPHKTEREERLAELKRVLSEHLTQAGISETDQALTNHLWEEAIDALVHKKILSEDARPDGRKLDEVRDLYAEVQLFRRTHGSALFVRGNTQALAVTTLAPPNAEQLIETMEYSGKRRFLLHYNFPPYSVGETAPLRGPGRREIGHGALAGKALRNLIPSKTEFPYTIRVVSEILSSNGSSSMASVCAASLSLMDAGVPIKKPVAGIAMGLMVDREPTTDNRQPIYKILTDIQGPEDHYGDMDLKAAGTRDGLTAIQMDVKINGLTPQMLGEVLAAAKKARLRILDVMQAVLPAPRAELSPFAPIILTTAVPPQKIGEVIGPGGKVINGIIARTGALSIDIEENGEVFVAADTPEKARAAIDEVKAIVREYKVGEIVEGPVVKIMDFGAIVQLGPKQDGMIHVSELKNGFVKNVEEVVRVGDRVRAKILRADPDGRIGLTLKNVGGESGAAS